MIRVYYLFLFQSTNRTLLKWLKLWDFVVYNKDKKDKDKKSKAQDKKKLEQKKFFNKNMPEVNEELDQLNRPMLKVCYSIHSVDQRYKFEKYLSATININCYIC